MMATQLMYETEFKKKMVYLHLNEGRTIASLSAEYGFAKSTYREWEKKYCEECQENEEAKEEFNLMEQNRMLKKMLAESHRKVMEMAAGFTNEELFTKRYYNWTGTTDLGAYFVSTCSSHYEWAIKKIKAHCKKTR